MFVTYQDIAPHTNNYQEASPGQHNALTTTAAAAAPQAAPDRSLKHYLRPHSHGRQLCLGIPSQIH